MSRAIFGLLIALAVGPVLAYDLSTHGVVTVSAVQRSQLVDADLQRRLGIDLLTFPSATWARPFDDGYVDMGSDLRVRTMGGYELSFLPQVSGFARDSDSLKTIGWVARGSIREDDSPLTFEMLDDPINAARPFNHFYDPAHDVPLTRGGITNAVRLGRKNPDWALGAVNAFDNPVQVDGLRQNHFSIVDAREAMWRALTLRDKNGVPMDDLGGLSKESVRKAYSATTFRALGDVVHMVQDLAQPQHARNEPHSGIGPPLLEGVFTGHDSVIEKYTDLRATGGGVDLVGDFGSGMETVRVEPAPLPPLGTYPVIPRFNRFVDYFSTSPGSPVNAGWGMADFTNRKFFSAFKNLGGSDQTLPSNNPTDYAPCTDAVLGWDGLPVPGNVQVEMLCMNLTDEVLQAPGNVTANFPMTARSVWDQFLQSKGATATYQLNKQIYDRQTDVLLPKAVAYSAGLIDYFFRGQMEISSPDAGVYALIDHADLAGDGKPATGENDFKGFKKLRLKLRNTTPDVTPPGAQGSFPQAMGPGKLAAVIKFHRNSCYNDQLSGASGEGCRRPTEHIIVSNLQNVDTVGTQFGEDLTFTFDTEIPINMTDAYLQIVFRGVLGAEADAVVVETKDIAEPTYASYFNATDMIWVGGGLHTRDEVKGDPALLAQLADQGCRDAQGALIDSCLLPLNNMGVALSLTSSNSSIGVWSANLPLRRYVRIAYLADKSAGLQLNQTGDCVLPVQAPATSVEQQVSVIGPGQTNSTFSSFPTIRGINGWDALSCVLQGGTTAPPPQGQSPLPGMTTIPADSRPYALTSVPQWP